MANQRQRGNEIGATGATIAYNVHRLRTTAALSLRELSNRLTEQGRPMSISAISKIENLERRVDGDELMTLAITLGVNPNALLLPPTIVVGHYVTLTGESRVDAPDVWAWARGERPLIVTSPRSGAAGETIRERQEQLKAAWAAEADKFRARVSPGAPHDAGPGVEHLVPDSAADSSDGQALMWERLPTNFDRG